ncbi:MAG: hypothetical protein K2I02_05190, partial [Duncaniella sp.]|nr:hypothetical protein [Duncaniella sp.]
MTFKLYICKKMNSRGNVEISLRFRHGKVDQQSCTNLWIKPMFVVKEDCSDDIGNDSSGYVLKMPDDGMSPGDVTDYRQTVDSLERLKAYIEDRFCMMRRHTIEAGWLAETIERFHADEIPRLEEERTEVLGLIDAYIEITSVMDSSESRAEAYALMRRSLARYDAHSQLRFPRFS